MNKRSIDVLDNSNLGDSERVIKKPKTENHNIQENETKPSLDQSNSVLEQLPHTPKDAFDDCAFTQLTQLTALAAQIPHAQFDSSDAPSEDFQYPSQYFGFETQPKPPTLPSPNKPVEEEKGRKPTLPPKKIPAVYLPTKKSKAAPKILVALSQSKPDPPPVNNSTTLRICCRCKAEFFDDKFKTCPACKKKVSDYKNNLKLQKQNSTQGTEVKICSYPSCTNEIYTGTHARCDQCRLRDKLYYERSKQVKARRTAQAEHPLCSRPSCKNFVFDKNFKACDLCREKDRIGKKAKKSNGQNQKKKRAVVKKPTKTRKTTTTTTTTKKKAPIRRSQRTTSNSKKDYNDDSDYIEDNEIDNKISNENNDADDHSYFSLYGNNIIQTIFIWLFFSTDFENCNNFALVSKLFNAITKQTIFKYNIFEFQMDVTYTLFFKLAYIKEKIEEKVSYEKNLDSMLLCSAREGFHDLIAPLVSYGADVSKKFDFPWPPLVAASKNYLKTVKQLILNGINVEQQNPDGSTGLLIATEYGSLDIVTYLISAGANINHQNTAGFSAVFRAIQFKRIEILEFLICQNANLDQKNSKNESALEFAKRMQFQKGIQLLENSSQKDAEIKTEIKTEVKTEIIAQIMGELHN